MPPYGLYSLANTPEELLSKGYGQDRLYDYDDYDPAFGTLRTVQRYQPAPFTGARPFQTMYDIAPYTPNGANLGFNADLYNPSFGGISGYRDVGGNQNQDTNIMQQAPLDMNRFQGVSDMSIIDETTNDEQDQNYIDMVNNKQNGLMSFLRSLPTPFNLARRGLESLRGPESLSDFRNSRTGAEFFKRRRDREALARDPNVFRDARNITSNLRRTASDNVIDRGRGQSNIASRASKGPTGARRGIDSRNKSSIDPAKGRKG